jgi:hypothetical protein
LYTNFACKPWKALFKKKFSSRRSNPTRRYTKAFALPTQTASHRYEPSADAAESAHQPLPTSVIGR